MSVSVMFQDLDFIFQVPGSAACAGPHITSHTFLGFLQGPPTPQSPPALRPPPPSPPQSPPPPSPTWWLLRSLLSKEW